MQVFYVDAPTNYGLQKFPLVDACYPRRVLLKAKTKKEAVREAWRIQQDCDVTAWDLIEQLKHEGHDWKRAYELSPCYSSWLYCFDSETGETSHV